MISRNPDAEMRLMQKMWHELETLPLAGRRRALVYLFSRLDDMAPEGNGIDHGPQQFDLEDALRTSNVRQLSA